ncbi:MAG TPA: peptidylprolyl isomerase [Caulobacteraceae bacterium]|jgi:peptidylprolyl isomerase
MRRSSALVCALAALLSSPAVLADPPPAGPAAIVTAAPAADWATFDANDLLVMDLAGGRRVVIALAPDFAPAHVANIRALARAHWYDGLSVERVQDDYVTQWGDPDGKKPLPPELPQKLAPEYDRPAAGLAFTPLPYRDTYADQTGAAGAFPAAESGGAAWAVHCYGSVGVGRDLNPDTGTSAELYAVIGQSPRGLDRNIAVVGRVLSGVDILASLPRGTADMGFYADAGQRIAIVQERLAADLPANDRPSYQYLKPSSASYAAWIAAKAHRQDTFFLRAPGAVDVCNAIPPVRPTPR